MPVMQGFSSHSFRKPRVVILVIMLFLTKASCAGVPILLYHRFGQQASDSMTVRTEAFESQMNELERMGYHVIPLRRIVDYVAGHGPPPPPHSLAITVDDGHRSVYTDLLPIALRHRIPVTLFIYPSAISRASYAMTWQQLHELQATGLFDIQSHTYWHPNFRQEKRRLDREAYSRFVDMQLVKSRQLLESRTGEKVDMLAWPFGIHDGELQEHAIKAGYVAAFTMVRRAANGKDNPMAIPRYLITDAVSKRAFLAIFKNGKDIRQ